MDKKVFGLIGGTISALALVGPAHAASSVAPATIQSLAASSFDELLQPLPHAVSILQKVDEFLVRSQGQPLGANLLLVEHHHHHHHQNSYQQRGYQGGGDQNGYQGGGDQSGYQSGDQGGYQGGDQSGYQGGDQGGFQGGDQSGYQGGDQGGGYQDGGDQQQL